MSDKFDISSATPNATTIAAMEEVDRLSADIVERLEGQIQKDGDAYWEEIYQQRKDAAAEIKRLRSLAQAATMPDGDFQTLMIAEAHERYPQANGYSRPAFIAGAKWAKESIAAQPPAATVEAKFCECLGGSTYLPMGSTERHCDLCGLPVPRSSAATDDDLDKIAQELKAANVIESDDDEPMKLCSRLLTPAERDLIVALIEGRHTAPQTLSNPEGGK